MSEKEKRVVEKLRAAIPYMSEFDKGYILGKVESMVKQEKEQEGGSKNERTTDFQK